jgi:hypothetical protein
MTAVIPKYTIHCSDLNNKDMSIGPQRPEIPKPLPNTFIDEEGQYSSNGFFVDKENRFTIRGFASKQPDTLIDSRGRFFCILPKNIDSVVTKPVYIRTIDGYIAADDLSELRERYHYYYDFLGNFRFSQKVMDSPYFYFIYYDPDEEISYGENVSGNNNDTITPKGSFFKSVKPISLNEFYQLPFSKQSEIFEGLKQEDKDKILNKRAVVIESKMVKQTNILEQFYRELDEYKKNDRKYIDRRNTADEKKRQETYIRDNCNPDEDGPGGCIAFGGKKRRQTTKNKKSKRKKVIKRSSTKKNKK